MKIITVESLMKEHLEMTPKDMWWELRCIEDDAEIQKKWQTTFPQMMNQIDLLVKENKILLDKDGTYIWLVPSKKFLKAMKDVVEL